VGADDERAASDAVVYLRGRGHQQIASIAGPRTISSRIVACAATSSHCRRRAPRWSRTRTSHARVADRQCRRCSSSDPAQQRSCARTT
jgi:DNA-binding LacI/PurR family transcriptional regulator